MMMMICIQEAGIDLEADSDDEPRKKKPKVLVWMHQIGACHPWYQCAISRMPLGTSLGTRTQFSS